MEISARHDRLNHARHYHDCYGHNSRDRDESDENDRMNRQWDLKYHPHSSSHLFSCIYTTPAQAPSCPLKRSPTEMGSPRSKYDEVFSVHS